MASELTPKQKRFVAEYLIDLNATAAAKRAGYSEETAKEIGYENLTKPHIQELIASSQAERSARTLVTADYVISTIKETIERCKQAEPVMKWDGERMVETGEWKFEYNGVLKGTEQLGRHLKLFTDKVDVNISGPLAERLAKARKRAAGD